MPKVNINGIGIYYELDGEGEVIVFLNGIMMSTLSWVDFVGVYTASGYQLLRVDFRDQGLSDRSIGQNYNLGQQVDDLKGLFDYLEFKKVHLLGVSYGGQVALLFTLKYPQMVKSLILANTTARLSNHLKAIGEAWDEAARLHDSEKFFKLVMPFIYSDHFYESQAEWLKERQKLFSKLLTAEWFEAYLRLSSSNGDFNVLERLQEITVPTLVIGADRDLVTPLDEVRKLHAGIKGAQFLIIPGSGHASFYEKKDEFNTAVLGFLASVKASERTGSVKNT